jgi:type II secretory pathway pseudopilin PulG
MMNHRVGPHHKMWTKLPLSSGYSITCRNRPERPSDAGYALVALLALMTVLALFALAAAPSIRQQAQREREIETIYRGEEVADAIRIYYAYQQGKVGPSPAALPTSIDKLLEGIPSGSKKVQILRPSAARNPLSDSGEWSLVRPLSAQLADFQRAVMLFAGNVLPPTNDQYLKQGQSFMITAVLPTISGLPTEPSSTSPNDDDTSTGPFIGVSPNSKSKSVINYYGIDRHDGWIFTPLFR